MALIKPTPRLCRLPLERRVRADFAFGLSEPHDLSTVGLTNSHDEIRVVLPGSIVFVVSHRKVEPLVLEVADDVPCGIEKIGELLFQIRMARHLAAAARQRG